MAKEFLVSGYVLAGTSAGLCALCMHACVSNAAFHITTNVFCCRDAAPCVADEVAAYEARKREAEGRGEKL